MSVLSDGDVAALQEGRVRVDPFDAACLQPSSVDLHLDRQFRVFHNHRYPFIDPRAEQADLTEVTTVADDEPFILHPGEFVLGQTLEWVELPDDVVARLEGKALALDTPVPTPTGWRTMGDLEPGDTVFDECGAPTQVVAATEPLLGRPCREVIFSDGQRVVADAAHQWATVDKQGRRAGRQRLSVRTTDEIARTLRVPARPPSPASMRNTSSASAAMATSFDDCSIILVSTSRTAVRGTRGVAAMPAMGRSRAACVTSV